MKSEAKVKNKQPKTFIQRNYNVKGYVTNPNGFGNDNVMANIINALIKGLNEENFLPKYVLVVLDIDLLWHINHWEGGLMALTGTVVNWITNQMIRTVEVRKDDLTKVYTGTAIDGEPLFVWVKMFNRIKQSSNNPLFAVRDKYNRAIEEILAAKRGHYIIDINNAMQDPAYFDEFNQLNPAGQRRFWIEIDRKIEKFEEDKRKYSLKPVVATENREQERSAPNRSSESSGGFSCDRFYPHSNYSDVRGSRSYLDFHNMTT